MKTKSFVSLLLVSLFLLANNTVQAAGLQLPQTGESSFNWMLILGLVVLVVALFILFGKNKKR